MKKLLIIIGVTIGLNTSIVAGPIHDAAKNGDIEEIKALINGGINVDEINHDDTPYHGLSPLHIAAMHDNKDLLEFLLSLGANVNLRTSLDGESPIFWAASHGNVEAANILIKNGANLEHRNILKETPLMWANDNVTALLLINNGSYPNSIDINGWSPLHHAVIRSTSYHEDTTALVKTLMKKGSDINALDFNGKTPKEFLGTYYDNSFNFGIFWAFEEAEAKSGYQILREKVAQLSTGTTNATDEWPRKMWEIDLGEPIGPLDHEIGIDNSIVFHTGRDSHWVTKEGKSFRIQNTFIGSLELMYLDNKNLIYKTHENREISVNLLTRNDELVALNQINIKNLEIREFARNSSHIGLSKDGTKITAWDFTPPTLASADQDDGNSGGNDTANSRLIIKTDGPDIALATDGKLGAGELQKSNDLRSWRKLSDVPKEASEVLVTPRDSGNEFYRLKKK